MLLKIEKVFYDNQNHIGVHVHFADTDNREKIKTIEGRAWHPQAKLWVVPYNTATFKKLQETFTEGWEIVPSEKPRVIASPIQPPKLEIKADWQSQN
jgi:hypothetical protein